MKKHQESLIPAMAAVLMVLCFPVRASACELLYAGGE